VYFGARMDGPEQEDCRYPNKAQYKDELYEEAD
jgi:hypothetical protein